MANPTTTDQAPYLNIAAPGFSMHSEELRDARANSWYARTNYGLAILRYAEVTQLLKHPSLSQGSAKWPDHHGVHSGLFHDWWSKNLLVLEGEEHHRIRRLLNPAFSPASARDLAPQFEAIAEELVQGFVNDGRAEFVADFAAPFASRALCAMMGLPHHHWQFIAERADTVGYALGVTVKEDIDKIDAAIGEFYEFVEQLIAERTQNPGSDIVSRLVQYTDAGDKLTPAELRNAIVLMLFGGMDTTRNQLGLILQTYIRNPQQWEILAAQPELARAAIEEGMRVNPTTTWVTREAIEDFEFQGLQVAAGTTVHLFTYAAGTDPQAYPDGDDIDILATDRVPHHTFGGGVHHCLGHYIARADMSAALPILARHLTNIRAADGDRWLPDSGNTGPIEFPITFDRRS
ncbi:MAG TPA: cytochrome P450 [Microbacterium sp.]|nr:cytochrome P450 [Microbacterium sp.]|tara:strand:+ start:423 stop:1634 length:1212 start_codon:yes stop_codon:yes gene_type:complete